MNDAEEIAENVIGFEPLLDSMYKCKKGVIWKDSVAHYYLNGIEETLKLEKQLREGTYKAKALRLIKRKQKYTAYEKA